MERQVLITWKSSFRHVDKLFWHCYTLVNPLTGDVPPVIRQPDSPGVLLKQQKRRAAPKAHCLSRAPDDSHTSCMAGLMVAPDTVGYPTVALGISLQGIPNEL